MGNRGDRRQNRAGPRASESAAPQARDPAGDRFLYGINPVIELLRVNPERLEGLFLSEGQVPAGAAGEILSRAREARVPVTRVPRERLHALASGGVHQGVVAEVRAFEYLDLDRLLELAATSQTPPLLVALDGIQDPQNLGAIARSAHALGAHGIIIPKDRAAQVTGAAAKAAAGALAHCPVARVVNLSRALEELKQAGIWTVAADPDAPEPLWRARLDGPLAVVVGAEGAGVREGVLRHCDLRVRIPMIGQVASLNASVSAAILLYEIERQRSTGPVR